MSKNDARKLNLDQLHERRKQVVRLHGDGHAVMKIVQMTGMSWPAVRSAIDRYETGGTDAIKPAVRGRRDGDGRSLTEQQEASMRELICTRRPDQLGLSERMWSRSSVDQLIQRECALRLSERAVGNYVNRWGFSAAAPLPQQPQSVDERLTAWLRGDYRGLVQRARSEQSEIQWLQTRRLHDGDTAKQDLNASIAGGRVSLQRHVLFAVSNQRKTRWMVSPETPDDHQWAIFLDALTADVGKSILIQPARCVCGEVRLAPNTALFDKRSIVFVAAGEVTGSTGKPEPVEGANLSAATSSVASGESARLTTIAKTPPGLVMRNVERAASIENSGGDPELQGTISLKNDRSHPCRIPSSQAQINAPRERSLRGSITRIHAIAAVAVVAAIAAVGVAAMLILSRPDALLDSQSSRATKRINVNSIVSQDGAAHIAYPTVDFSPTR